MDKNVLLENNSKLMKNIQELLKNVQEEEITNCLYRILEMLNKASLADTNNVYRNYLLMKEDERLFDQLVAKVNDYLSRKYRPIENTKRLILTFQQLLFSIDELEEIDERTNDLTKCLNGVIYSKQERKEIEDLLLKLRELRITFLPLFEDENDRGIDIVKRLSKKEQKRIWKVLENKRTIKGVFDDFVYNVQDTFEYVRTKKDKKDKESIRMKNKFFSLKEKWDFKKKGQNIYEKIKGIGSSIQEKIRDRKKEKKHIFSSKSLADYLTYKNYCLTEKFLKKDKEKITNKDLKKYSKKIDKIDRKYDQILNGHKANEVFDDIQNVSAMHAKLVNENARRLLKYNADGYLDVQSYLDYIQQLELSQEEKSEITETFDDLYHRNLTFKECMERIPENLEKVKKESQKVMRKMSLMGTGIAVGMALIISSVVPNTSKSKTNEFENEKEDEVIVVTPKPDTGEEIHEENKETIHVDESLENEVDKEELTTIKDELLKIQKQLQENTSRVENAINVGDFVSIDDQAYIYKDIYSLANEENGQIPLYSNADIRVVESVVYQHESGQILEENTMDHHESLLSDGYYVIGYTLTNQYSGENVVVEGRYLDEDVMKLTRK